jgi:hypothetical protein
LFRCRKLSSMKIGTTRAVAGTISEPTTRPKMGRRMRNRYFARLYPQSVETTVARVAVTVAYTAELTIQNLKLPPPKENSEDRLAPRDRCAGGRKVGVLKSWLELLVEAISSQYSGART